MEEGHLGMADVLFGSCGIEGHCESRLRLWELDNRTELGVFLSFFFLLAGNPQGHGLKKF